MKTVAILTTTLLASASAFAPSTAGFGLKQTQLRMAEEVEEDMNFDNLDLAKVLGAKRLSNIKRKLKRQRNQAAKAAEKKSGN
mmetsp:Transcript_14728/g.21742  ORF Transcript_14728/g.21742 Transcript_14728/m.21742 type:complete len:83 (+) Transcript_14728:89-337(+)